MTNSNPTEENRAFFEKSSAGRQIYSKLLIISKLLLIFIFQLPAQSNENQLVIIKKKSEYQAFIYQNPSLKLVKLQDFITPIHAKIPYKTANNFTNQRLYGYHQFWVALEVAKRLKNVQDSLIRRGLSLYFYDTYRPHSVTRKMWAIVPDERYAANPAKGSGHNRGIAVDVSLCDAVTGKPLKMPTEFDNFSDTAHLNFWDLPEEVLNNRETLKNVMEHFGFRALSTEWWHFSLPNSGNYPVLDLPFRKLKRIKPPKGDLQLMP